MKSVVIPLNQWHFGLHSIRKPYGNYERLETFKVVFGSAILVCVGCTIDWFQVEIIELFKPLVMKLWKYIANEVFSSKKFFEKL